jgi:phospholipase/carboxylesterase
MDAEGTTDPEMFRSSFDRLKQFIPFAVKEYPIDPERLFLFGFSMGTMMALALALTSPGLLRGVIANSGYVPEDAGLTFQWTGLAATPFFLAHGAYDPVIPVTLGRRTKELFGKSDAQWVYREYPMGHEISPESLSDISEWLRRLI